MKISNKEILYVFSSFIAGFSVMTVELISSRIVAPIIGSSVFTWTSVIGITLLGMSVGSFIGGKIADKTQGNKSISLILLSSAILIFLIPTLAENTGFITTSSDSILKLNLLLSIYLFMLPATTLGMIQPMILKKYADDFSKIGSKYGILSAVWSIGSVLGIFLTGFYFISNIGSKETIYLISLILFLLGVIFAIKNKKIILFFLLIAIITPYVFGNTKTQSDKNTKILFQKETDYYNARIVNAKLPGFGDSKILFLDFDSHSIETKEVNKFAYPEMYPVFGYLNNNIKDILVIGAGAYTMPKKFKDYYNNAKVSVMETDPEIINIGKNYFGLGNYDIKTIIGDARFTLEKNPEKYDVIFGDAYNSFISVPWYLLTREWNEKVKDKLNENGIYAINFIGTLSREGGEFTKSVANTFKESFPNFYIFSFGANTEMVQNIVLIGVKNDSPISELELYKKLANSKDNFFADRIIPAKNLSNQNSIILTDNFSPVEKLMEPTIKDYFSENLSFIRKVF
jgi:spermidine synthase